MIQWLSLVNWFVVICQYKLSVMKLKIEGKGNFTHISPPWTC